LTTQDYRNGNQGANKHKATSRIAPRLIPKGNSTPVWHVSYPQPVTKPDPMRATSQPAATGAHLCQVDPHCSTAGSHTRECWRTRCGKQAQDVNSSPSLYHRPGGARPGRQAATTHFLSAVHPFNSHTRPADTRTSWTYPVGCSVVPVGETEPSMQATLATSAACQNRAA
jgi:hypothetical protein